MLSQSLHCENARQTLSDANRITCPECDTVQRGEAPFCDNCGYRVGRLDTAEEGYRAISRASGTDGDDTRLEQPAVSSADHTASTSRPSLAATQIEGYQGITPEVAARHRTDTPGLGRDVTEVEGMQALPPSGVPTETGQEPVSEPHRPHPPRPHPPQERRSRAILWLFLWVLSLVVVAMVTDYTVRHFADSAQASIDIAGVPAEPVAIAAGSFRRGLDEGVRSFILTSCLKMAEDKSICDQEELLAGEYPEERVELGAYRIDPVEVTVEEWEGCVGANQCQPVNYKECKVYTHQGLQSSLRVPKTLQEGTVPVTCVTRAQAADYCAYMDGRLPTGDEWERAARGTDGRVFPWGSHWDPVASNWGEADVARMPVVGKIDGYEWVAPPARFPAGVSPANIWDMAGNVAEWVSGDDPENGIARGGSWTSTPFELRTTGRMEIDATARRTDVGFRCAY